MTFIVGQNTFKFDPIHTTRVERPFLTSSRRMIRAVLAITAVLIVVLAFLLDQPWLYGAAAVSLIGILGYLGRHFWLAYQKNTPYSPSAEEGPASSEDTLEDLGIMNVRPQEESAEDEGAEEPEASERSEEGTGESSAAKGETDGWPENTLSEEEMASMAGEPEAVHRGRFDEQPVVGPFLESLRAAMGAQSVCLLVQEEVALEYRVEAVASVQPNVQLAGTFETRDPLLTASMSRKPVTVRSLDATERQDLGYYDTVPGITQIAVAPIEQPESAATMFLLVDATTEVDLNASPTRRLLERYAETVAFLLDARAATPGTVAATDHLQSYVDASETVAAEAEVEDDAVASEGKPRPRGEIIAEEMEDSDAAGDALALVLVHLNRAESIARRGDEAVASAERHLRSRLEDLAPGQRVERFGELTYGVFVRHGEKELEGWAADLQESLGEETGELEGGVSVGVAVRNAHHDAKGLRADATKALLEAYETGTCTIIS